MLALLGMTLTDIQTNKYVRLAVHHRPLCLKVMPEVWLYQRKKAMNKQPDSLSEAEFELVMKHRASQTSATNRFARRLIHVAAFGFAVIGVIVFFQAAQLESSGGLGDIPAPLSWVMAVMHMAMS